MFNPVRRVLASVLIGVFVLTQAAVTSAWTPTPDRINVATFGGTGDDRGQSVVVDAAGNIYVTGSFSGTADLDPSSGTFNLTSGGGKDVFVTKLNSQGELLWGVRAGGTQNIEAYSVAIDAAGNVYLTGYFVGTADFDPSGSTLNLTSAGSGDVFVWKLDSSGALVWVKSAGGSGFDSGSSLAIDSSGDVYVTGQFSGTADFTPDGNVRSTLTSVGPGDVFVWKLDSAAVTRVIVRLGGTGTDRGTGIAIDSSGSLYLTGDFEGAPDFGPSRSTLNITSAGSGDVFVLKLQNFFVQWAKRAGGSGFDSGSSLAIDSSGDVYVTGNFQGPGDFTSDGTSITLTSAGADEIFIWKVDSTGAGVWAKSAGSAGGDAGRSVAVDSLGNVYITGYFRGTADFDPDGSSANLTSAGSIDVFVWKLSSAGVLMWARQARASTFSDGTSIDIDPSGNVYIAGSFQGTADFDPNENISNLTSAGLADVFVFNLTSAGAVAVTPAQQTPADLPTTNSAAALVGAPTEVFQRAGNKKVTVRWSAVDGAASYVVKNSVGVVQCTSTTTSCVMSNLRNGKAYTYRIFAVNADGVQSTSGTEVRVIPGFTLKKTSFIVKKTVKLSSIVTTPSKGKKTWQVTSGSCRLSGSKIVMPKKSGTCKVKLSVAKNKSYPAMSTTVRIAITK